MKTRKGGFLNTKWFFPIVYGIFTVISFLPPVTEKPFSSADTQDVIINLLMITATTYKHLGIYFHAATLILIVTIFFYAEKTSRFTVFYIGINYFVIALVQSVGNTEKYGYVIHTGGLIAFMLLGAIWIWSAFQGDLQTRFKRTKWHAYALLPLALLAFWSPYKTTGSVISADFNPALLLTSPDYGLTFCLTTPVFLYLLILFYPKINLLVYRVTAFNGLLYALFNLSHWFNPDTRWMGFLHVPLLVISLYALGQTVGHNKRILPTTRDEVS